MAEVPESEPIASSSVSLAGADAEMKEEEGPSPEKRRKLDQGGQEKLEHRLGGILCCAVCLDLPPAAVYQCSNGHLMCAPCFTHLLADARLRDEASTCPNCRVEISKTSASRNLAVEKTVSELPSECKYCACVFPRHSLQHHEEKKCEERRYKFGQLVVGGRGGGGGWAAGAARVLAAVYQLLLAALGGSAARGVKRRRLRRLTGCRYACIGCPWRGPHHECAAHEAACASPARSAADVIDALAARERLYQEENKVYNQVIDLLSYEKITFNDLQLKPYRTEEFVHKLYYETSRFSAFGAQWVAKAFVNKNQRDPTQSYERELSYQLILKSKTSCPLPLQWLALRGPYGEAAVRPRVAEHAFAEDAPDSAPQPLPLADPADTNRLLSNKAIHFRLIMFLASK
ncbi:cysteine and histidine-rich protein 1 homolog isoform X1 [Plutella xylostella]|uniref:cysteine and histidine-rich protein 1 homolog isoform X1 n=1 Tax=Plutella xylostella TaxID=51655 RepID=UPI0020328909|nr:cysteine and histidine-rich protein 1 homolog isoform X1 [Plutella xylostella]